MYEFKFPFEPPWEDCKMQLQTERGARMYIFDTLCKNQSPEERQRIDTELVRLYNDIVAREELKKLRQSG